ETKLHFLFDVAGEIVGGDPACVDIESGFPAFGVAVDDLQLDGIPGRTVGGSDQAALARRSDARELPNRAEGEVDQFDVVNGNVGPGIAAGNPLGELPAADRLRF